MTSDAMKKSIEQKISKEERDFIIREVRNIYIQSFIAIIISSFIGFGAGYIIWGVILK